MKTYNMVYNNSTVIISATIITVQVTKFHENDSCIKPDRTYGMPNLGAMTVVFCGN